MLKKLPKKEEKNCTRPPSPSELHIRIVKRIQISWVHGFEEKTKYHVAGYMNLKKKILMCSSAGGGGLVPNPPNV